MMGDIEPAIFLATYSITLRKTRILMRDRFEFVIAHRSRNQMLSCHSLMIELKIKGLAGQIQRLSLAISR
jgi:hypothetical protein